MGAECKKKAVGVTDMECLGNVLGVGVEQRRRNRDIRGRCRNKAFLLERVDQSILRWFSHTDRMNEMRLTKRINRAVVNGVRRNRPRRLGLGSLWSNEVWFREVREVDKGQE